MTLPLEGVKVVDLSRMAPGPFCTMVLGDLGADILKIEEFAPERQKRLPSREPSPGPTGSTAPRRRTPSTPWAATSAASA